MKAWILLLWIPLCIGGEREAFTIADYYRVKTPKQVAVNPFAPEVILFAQTTSNLEEGSTDTQIFRLNLSTQDLAQVTYSGTSNNHPMWSRDGSKIYFISTRNEGSQLWVMDASAGEARQLTHFYSGIEQPKLHPNGTSLFFVSTVFPECLADSECNQRMSRELEDGPAAAHLADDLLFRHWTAYRDFQYSHLFQLDLKSGKIMAITKGKIDYPAYGGSYDLSPDGAEIAITVKDVENPERSTNTDLFLIDLTNSSAVPMPITRTNKGYDGDPVYSPDGSKIAFRTQKRDGYESDLFELAIYDRQTASIIKATKPFDNWIQSSAWSPDSQSIFVTVHEKGYFPIYQVDLKSKSMTPFMKQVSVHDFWTANNGIFSVQSSVGKPRELFFQDYSIAGSQKQITHLNRDLLTQVDVRPAESVWIPSPTGRDIHTFIVKPHDFDPNKSYPLIINVHGGPQYQWADTFRGDWQVYPGAGYVVAFPNPHGSSGYGQAFTEAISGDYNGKVMQDIEAVTDYLAKQSYIDEDRMGAMGWSWGGYAMMWLEGNSSRYKALAAMMGIYDLASMYTSTEELWFVNWDNKGAPWENPEYYRAASPSSYVTNFKTPCLVITGELDYRVPYTQSLQFFTALQSMEVPSKLLVFPNDGHWPHAVKSMPIYYNAHLEWFNKYLGGEKAPYDTEAMVRNQAFKSK